MVSNEGGIKFLRKDKIDSTDKDGKGRGEWANDGKVKCIGFSGC